MEQSPLHKADDRSALQCNLSFHFHVMRSFNAVFIATSYRESDESSPHPHTISYFFDIIIIIIINGSTALCWVLAAFSVS
jgi:hypothetical protein